ncbi:MAG TPA: flagellar biosynthesis anti-sigma factor FlgM [Terriglobia bacterium]|nr:flagellar biosynthesis anti-sigma factor FlgM [Terriglobia bacterium]
MSIDRINISNQGIDRAQATQPNDLVRNAGKDRQVPAGSDSLALSSKAKELDQLAGSLDQSRTEHFNKVKQALESGTYHVSAKDLAQKLIDTNRK